jgi:hypothetical protein
MREVGVQQSLWMEQDAETEGKNLSEMTAIKQTIKACYNGKGQRTQGIVGSLTEERVYIRSDEDDIPRVHEWWKEKFNRTLVMSDTVVSEDDGEGTQLYLMKNGYILVMIEGWGCEVWKAKIENGKINLRLPGLTPAKKP